MYVTGTSCNTALDGATISGNTAKGSAGWGLNTKYFEYKEVIGEPEGGGGIYFYQSRLRIYNSTITNNYAYYKTVINEIKYGCGGGILAIGRNSNVSSTSYASLSILSSEIYSNTACFGGGIYVHDMISSLNNDVGYYTNGSLVYSNNYFFDCIQLYDSKVYDNIINETSSNSSAIYVSNSTYIRMAGTLTIRGSVSIDFRNTDDGFFFEISAIIDLAEQTISDDSDVKKMEIEIRVNKEKCNLGLMCGRYGSLRRNLVGKLMYDMALCNCGNLVGYEAYDESIGRCRIKRYDNAGFVLAAASAGSLRIINASDPS